MVPILRSGAVPAVYIANELNLVKFAPIQVKKIKQDGIYDHIILLNSLKDHQVQGLETTVEGFCGYLCRGYLSRCLGSDSKAFHSCPGPSCFQGESSFTAIGV